MRLAQSCLYTHAAVELVTLSVQLGNVGTVNQRDKISQTYGFVLILISLPCKAMAGGMAVITYILKFWRVKSKMESIF